MTRADGYLLDNRQAEAAERFDTFAALFGPVTFRHLEVLGAGPGRRCWEVGVGGTSWPAAKVGPADRVQATGIDTTHVAPAGHPPVEVRVHDVGADNLPEDGFDPVRARLVPVHVPDRDRASRSVLQAPRPGGYVLAEDAGPSLQPLLRPDEHRPAGERANRLRRGFATCSPSAAPTSPTAAGCRGTLTPGCTGCRPTPTSR